MAGTYITVVTDAGTRKMLEAFNAEKKVNIVEFAVGDGGGKFYTPSTDMEALKKEVWRGAVNACYVSEESENLLIIESVIPADVGGFTIREMGLFDDQGTLIAICNTPDTQKVRVADGVVSELDLAMEIALANTESVELIIDPSVVMATKKDIENLQRKIEECKATVDSELSETSENPVQNKAVKAAIDNIFQLPQLTEDDRNKILKVDQDGNVGWGSTGGGSVIRGTTTEENLYVKKVYAKKGDVILAEATINIAGQFTLSGITELGAITVYAADGEDVAEEKVTINTYSMYEVELSFDKVLGFDEDMSVLAAGGRITRTDACADFSDAHMDFSGRNFVYGQSNEWMGWKWLKKVLPYMVGFDGVADYQLDPDDYTKKAEDGTESDVANTAYEGGAYTWIPIIYRKAWVEGNVYHRRYCERKLDDSYEPMAFVDEGNNILPGVWIPMFYGTSVGGKIRSLATGTPINTLTTDAEHNLIVAAGDRHRFFGGPIVNLLHEILLMMGGNTDIQSTYGAGYNTGGSGAGSLKANAVIGGGMFFGTNDNGSLNKLFHSIVYGSFQQWQRDPYTLLINGTLYVSKNYVYDLSGARLTNTGVTYSTTSDWKYPDKKQEIDGFGGVSSSFNGTSATGYCDGRYAYASGTRVGLRFGTCDIGLLCGPDALNLNDEAARATWDVGAADLLLPPGGVAA